MREIDFTKIVGAEGVAKYFYTSPDFVRTVLEASDQNSFYKELKIPKKNIKRRKDYRRVYKCDPQIAQIQKNIGTAIEKSISLPAYVQGFVKNRSTVSNARQHLAKKFLLRADIQDFFDSITIDQVQQVFFSLGCNKDTAHILSRICTINSVLRQGLHTSPILSNLVVRELDADLQALAMQYEASYTRYSDDITMSSNSALPTREEVFLILKKYNFLPNEDKFLMTKRGQSQYVTGLSVFDSAYPRIPKRMKKRLRLNLYYIKKFGLLEHLERIGIPGFAQSFYYNHLKGTLDYINAVEPNLAANMYPLLPCLSGNFLAEEAATEAGR